MHRLRSLLPGLAFLVSALANGQQLAASKPFVPVNRWALVVGASAYSPEVGALRYTAKEAKEFAKTLKEKLDFAEGNVQLLADGGPADQTPTSPRILSALDSLLANPRLDKANLFIFYFSGHGVGTKNGDFLLPSDAKAGDLEKGAVPVRDVIERIVHAGLKNVLFIADACRAGEQNGFGGQFIELCRKANLAVILGCEPGKRSYEYPRLKSGAFTHFLIQDLSDESLLDESGTLWASKLGATVQQQVHDYTEPDYGANAQNPALWGERSTLDVLLATYPKQPVSDLAVSTFSKAAERLDKAEFASAMMEYAAQLLIADRDDKAVDFLRVVDQLGELTPLGQYLYGNSLNVLGRPGEANRVFAQLQSGPPSYYRDLALISSRSREVPSAKRVEAARRVIEGETGWVEKMLAWTVVQACGTYEQQLAVAKRFAAQSAADPRQRLYARGILADVEGRWADAATAFRTAMTLPGQYPKNREIMLALLHPTLASGDTAALAKWTQEGLKMPGCDIVCYVQKAYLASLSQDANGRVAAIREVLKRDPDPDEIWRAATLAGAQIGSLKQDFKAAAEKHPYSWRARLLLSFFKQLEGDPNAVDEMNLSDLYREDPLTFNSEVFSLMNGLLEEATRLGKVTELDYRRQVDLYFLGLMGSTKQFGYDPDLWGQFMQFGQLNERNSQVLLAVQRHIPYKPVSAPASLRPLLLLAALNAGDSKEVDKLGHVAYEPSEGDDPKWLYAAFLASVGREREASQQIKGLHPGSENLRPRMEALQTYLLATSGQTRAAKRRMKTTIDDLVVRGYYGLAWAAMGDWKRAEPLLREQVKSRNWAFLFVTAHAMRVLDDHYRKTGNVEGFRYIAYSAAASQPANALFLPFTYASKPSVSGYAGSSEMDCVIEDDVLCMKSMAAEGKKTYGFGRLSMKVGANGHLDAWFSDEQKNRYPFSGQLDRYGNLTGSADLNGRKFMIRAKLPPQTLYATYKPLRELGQIIEMIDGQGYRVALIEPLVL